MIGGFDVKDVLAVFKTKQGIMTVITMFLGVAIACLSANFLEGYKICDMIILTGCVITMVSGHSLTTMLIIARNSSESEKEESHEGK
jgi:hypothetical protein